MKFALAGNPNCGKTTLFNTLTKSTAHVGNWPGVTVDKRTGVYKKLAQNVDIIDLPGIYSLSPYTPEEMVSREFLLSGEPSCIINIVDATNFERNLYLTTQVLELDIPVIVALNMMDLVSKDGGEVDTKKLSSELGVPVVAISALKDSGIQELMETAYATAQKSRTGTSVLAKGKAAILYEKILALYTEANIKNAAFRAVKMLEGDELEAEANPEIALKAKSLKAAFDTKEFDGDFEGVVADARYKYITANYAPAQKKALAKNAETKSDKIDKVLTHRIWGIPLFLAIMLAVFHITFSENFLFIGLFIKEGSFDIPILGTDAINSPGVILFNIVDSLTAWLGDLVAGAMPEGTWYTSLVCDGLLSGLFAVLSFIPQIMVLFLFLSILEDTGYMARVAFIMDRAFRRFGLSGKALMPLIMCFGCAVPGIMATRTLENEQERKRAIFLAPFFSCGAKLPIWAAFAGVFSLAYTGLNAELVVFSMYILGIAVAVLAAFLLKKTALKAETPPFVLELPSYHAPRVRNTLVHLWQKLKHYIFRAATIIAGAIVVIWFLSTFSFTFKMVDDSGDSIIGVIAKGIRYIFIPLGFGMGENGFEFVVAAITGLIAKEMVVATMGTFAGLADDPLEMEGDDIASSALGLMMLSIGGAAMGSINIAIPAMFAFMAFNLLSVPCMAAVAAAGAELKNRKTLWFAIGFWLATAYLVSAAVFWLGVLIAACWWVVLILALLAAGAITAYVLLKKKGIIGTAKG